MLVLLQVLSMLRATKAEERRLLRVLQLRLCAMSTETDRNGMPGKHIYGAGGDRSPKVILNSRKLPH
jgi:hypothetical protein